MMPDWDRLAGLYRAQESLERPALAAAVGLGRPGPGDTVVDLACGPGTLARHLAREARDVARLVGVDGSRAMLARAARMGVEPVHADARDVALPDALGDLVVCLFFLHLVDDADRAATLGEVARLVAPGGRAVVAVPARPRSRSGRLVRTALRTTVASSTLRTVDLHTSIDGTGLVVTGERHVGERRWGYSTTVLRLERRATDRASTAARGAPQRSPQP